MVPYTSATLMNLRTHGLVSALIVLAILSVLLATQFTVTEARPVEAVPVKATDPVTEKAPKPSAKASKKTKESAYEKLALNKLVIERPTPNEPAPEPERNPEKESNNHPRAQVASVPVLPGPQRKVPRRKLLSGKPLNRAIRKRRPRSRNRAIPGYCSRCRGWGSRT